MARFYTEDEIRQLEANPHVINAADRFINFTAEFKQLGTPEHPAVSAYRCHRYACRVQHGSHFPLMERGIRRNERDQGVCDRQSYFYGQCGLEHVDNADHVNPDRRQRHL